MSTATATALLSALPEGRCPGLRGWRGPHLWLATLTLVRCVFPQGQKGEPGEIVSGLVGGRERVGGSVGREAGWKPGLTDHSS